MSEKSKRLAPFYYNDTLCIGAAAFHLRKDDLPKVPTVVQASPHPLLGHPGYPFALDHHLYIPSDTLRFGAARRVRFYPPYQTTLNKKKAITKSDQPTQRLRPRAKLQLHPSRLRPHRDHPLQRRQTEAALLLDIASHQDNALAGPVHHRHGRSGNCCCLIPGRARDSNRYRDTCRYLVRTPVLPSTIPLSLALC